MTHFIILLLTVLSIIRLIHSLADTCSTIYYGIINEDDHIRLKRIDHFLYIYTYYDGYDPYADIPSYAVFVIPLYTILLNALTTSLLLIIFPLTMFLDILTTTLSQ